MALATSTIRNPERFTFPNVPNSERFILPKELKRLTDFAHLNGMYVHMDGARIANACAALRLSL